LEEVTFVWAETTADHGEEVETDGLEDDMCVLGGTNM
jgi:hypothetical protein